MSVYTLTQYSSSVFVVLQFGNDQKMKSTPDNMFIGNMNLLWNVVSFTADVTRPVGINMLYI